MALKQFTFDLYTAIQAIKKDNYLMDIVMLPEYYEAIYKRAKLYMKRNSLYNNDYEHGDVIMFLGGSTISKGSKYTMMQFALMVAFSEYYYVTDDKIKEYLQQWQQTKQH